MNGMNGNPPGQVQQVQIPITRRVLFDGPNVNVAKLDNGDREIQIIDAGSGTIYIASLSAQGAQKLGRELISSLPTAGLDEMPRGGS